MTTSRKTFLFSALAVCLMALPANAVPIFQPDTGVTDQGVFDGPDIASGFLSVHRLFEITPSSVENDGAGHTGLGDVVTDSTDTVDGALGNPAYAYASEATGTTYPGILTFGFSSGVSMDTFYLWNISHPAANGPRERGIKDFELKLYDGLNASGTLLTTVSNLTAAIGPLAGVDIPSQAFDLGGIWAGVQSVELIVATRQNEDLSGNSWFGAREIAFSVVPEPASATLLFSGLIGLGVLRRRR